jgi:endonuclease/exonuclease/phosphatase family metal-dependent hydrolase
MVRRSDKYNSEPFGTPKRRSNDGSAVGALLAIVLLVVTVSLSVVLLIAYLTPHVAPSTFGSLTIVGIFAPILYIGEVICLLCWMIMGRWKIVGVVALLLVPGLFHISDFYNVVYMRQVEQKPSRGSFTLMSYNVRGFRNDSSSRAVDNHVAYFESQELADIVCFQEYALDIPNVERIDSLFNARQNRLYVKDVVESGEVVLRTYSRFPIVGSGSLSGEGRGTSLWVDVIVGKNDTLRVFNNHLHSMNISSEDSSDIEHGKILNDGDRMQSIVDRIAKNSSIRAEYVDTLRTIVDSSPYRNIICGDFNDTPMSYVYGELKDGYVDAFEQCGSGYGYTFRPMHGTLRIDYILFSQELEAESYLADKSNELSDHLPITARLKIRPKEQKK